MNKRSVYEEMDSRLGEGGRKVAVVIKKGLGEKWDGFF